MLSCFHLFVGSSLLIFFSQLLLLLIVQAGPPTQSVTKAELAQQMGLAIVPPLPAGMSAQAFYGDRMPSELVQAGVGNEIIFLPLPIHTATLRPDFVGHLLTDKPNALEFMVHLNNAPNNLATNDQMPHCTEQLEHSMGPKCRIMNAMESLRNWQVKCADELFWRPPPSPTGGNDAFFQFRHTDADRFAVDGFPKTMAYARFTIAYLPLTMPDEAYCTFSLMFNSRQNVGGGGSNMGRWFVPSSDLDFFKAFKVDNYMLLLQRDQLPPGVGQEINAMPPTTTPDLPGPQTPPDPSLPSSSSSTTPFPPTSPDSSSSSSSPSIEPSSTEPSSSSSSSSSSSTSTPETTQPTSPTLKSSSSSSLKPSLPPPKTKTTGKVPWKFPSEMPMFRFDFEKPI